MKELENYIDKFLDDCRYMKGLSDKTLKAYFIDLKQFNYFCADKAFEDKETVESFIKYLYSKYKPKTSKRKIACLKVFFRYLENEEIIENNIFHKINIKRREPVILPKVIPVTIVTNMLEKAYSEMAQPNKTNGFYKVCSRNIAVLEMLFATGMRVSELCNLKRQDINIKSKYVKVFGKGAKERYIQLTNENVITSLKKYERYFSNDIKNCGYYFINNRGNRLSEQSVRIMVDKLSKKANSEMHITPHMFRHTVASLLLEEDVDIRYIQELLGHSSITTTQIYTHVSLSAQKKILTKKHPRNKIKINI